MRKLSDVGLTWQPLVTRIDLALVFVSPQVHKGHAPRILRLASELRTIAHYAAGTRADAMKEGDEIPNVD